MESETTPSFGESIVARPQRNASEQVRKFKEIIESLFYTELLKNIRKGDRVLVIPFPDLSKYDPDLANDLLDDPDEVVRAAEIAVSQFDLEQANKPVRIRFSDLPRSQNIMIRNIRSEHLEKFIVVDGIVRQKSDVRPQVTSAKFECPNCGNRMNVLQLDSTFKEPSKCGCGRKGHFLLLEQELVNAQGIVMEESPENLDGGEQPKRINVLLKDDLVSPLSEKRTSPGSKIVINGVLKQVPIISRTGAKLTKFDLVLEANFVSSSQESFYEVELSEEDVTKIKEISEDPRGYDKIIASMAPSIYGYDKIKESLLLQMLGGVRKVRNDKVVSRGDMHILLVGDPGSGKSQLLKRVAVISPKSRYVSGKGVSGAGLTASVVRDEFLKGWALEAGALVLASDGLCCLHPKSEVVFDDRLIPIESLFDSRAAKKVKIGKDEAEICALNGDVNAADPSAFVTFRAPASIVRRKWHRGKMLTIRMNSGMELRLTPDHKLLDGKSAEWKAAEEFKAGECLISPLKIWAGKENVLFEEILGEKYLSSKRYARSRSSGKVLIDRMTPQISYLFGFIAGDGGIENGKRRSKISITQSTKKKEQLEKLREAWRIVSSEPLKEDRRVRKAIIRGKEVVSETVTFYIGCRLIADAYEKAIGHSLEHAFSLPEECLKAFLAGAMDADGCLSTKNSVKKGRPYAVQHADFILFGDVKTNRRFVHLLRRLDIAASIRKTASQKVSSVQIVGRVDIGRLIEMLSPYSLKLSSASLIERKAQIGSAADIVPAEPISKLLKGLLDLPRKVLLERGIWSTVHGFMTMKRLPSRGQIARILDSLGDTISSDLRRDLSKYCERDILLDRIESVEEKPYEGYVYDLYVPGHHNFTADGVIVHNCIDEMDKMGVEDRAAMHEALEQQTVSVSKANIQATLISRTTVLAAANPKFGRFDPYGIVGEQIDLPPTLINRFDLIFPIKDLPDETRDDKLASHILGLHQNPDVSKPDLSTDMLKKFIAYARQYVHPRLTNEAIEEIKAFYLKMRMSGSDDGGVKTIPISARQLEALVRMSEAAARSRLSDVVLRRDAKKAIELLEYCLLQVGLDKETGKIDIDRIATGVGASQRSHIIVVKEVLTELEAKLGKAIPMEDVVNESRNRGLDAEKVEEAIEKLKRAGDIFEPRRGFLSKL